MKLSFFAQISIIVIAITLSGCGKDPDAGKTVITYWRHYYETEDAGVQELISRFEKANPGIRIKYQSMPYKGFREKLDTSLKAGKGPDIINIHNSWIYPFAKSELLVPIPETVLSAETLNEKYISLTKSFGYSGKQLGLPIGGGCLALFINFDHLIEAGLSEDTSPADWKELEALALKLTVKEGDTITRTGFACGGTQSQSWNYLVEGLFRQNGAAIINPQGTEVLWNSEAGIEAFTWYMSFVTKHGIFDPDMGKPSDLFIEGRASMIADLNVVTAKIAKTNPGLRYRVVPLPMKKQKATYGSAWGNCVTSSCPEEKREAAFRFLMFLTSEDSARFWTDKTGELPMFRSVLRDKAFRIKHEALLPFIDSMEYAYSSLKKDETAYKGAIVEAIEKVTLKGEAPAAALGEAASKVNAMLKAR